MKRPRPWRLRAAGLGAHLIPGLRVADRGAGGHDDYFAGLSAALRRAGVARPTLVIDTQRLARNVAAIREPLAGSGMPLRVVTKSLQAPELLAAVLKGAGTDRLMVFNGVMLGEIAALYPDADVLLGRPLPAVEVATLVWEGLGALRPQWLVDSAPRLTQYMEIARAKAAPMRINFEIDVGLHRGGFAAPADLAAAIDLALAEPLIEIAGLMGYDPHAAASPKAEGDRVIARYGAFAAVLTAKTGRPAGDFILNTAGSLTWRAHLADPIANEVSIGSAFLKPTHFDAPSLADLAPAVFIAEPVLKALDPALIPGLESHAAAIEARDPNTARGFFLYGGYGDARVVSPRGLAWSRLYGGRSMLTGSRRVKLDQDDFVFLRPTESEGVLLQFGDIAAFDGQDITAWWPTFAVAA